MPHIQGVQRDAVLLFPPSLDQYITDDNPVRFVVTDAKHNLIVVNDVTNDPTDSDQLAPLAIAAKEVLGVERLEATADMGYAHGEQVKQCESAKIVAYVPKPHTSRSQHKGLFTKDDFRYDATNDTYTCPHDAILTFRFQTTEKGRDTR